MLYAACGIKVRRAKPDQLAIPCATQQSGLDHRAECLACGVHRPLCVGSVKSRMRGALALLNGETRRHASSEALCRRRKRLKAAFSTVRMRFASKVWWTRASRSWARTANFSSAGHTRPQLVRQKGKLPGRRYRYVRNGLGQMYPEKQLEPFNSHLLCHRPRNGGMFLVKQHGLGWKGRGLAQKGPWLACGLFRSGGYRSGWPS